MKVFGITLWLCFINAICFAEEAADVADSKLFDQFTEVFMKFGVDGVFNLKGQALYLIGVFAIISLCTNMALYSGDIRLNQMIVMVLKTAFFIMLALSWTDFLNMIFKGFHTAGIVAATGNTSGLDLWSPSALISQGDRLTSELGAAVWSQKFEVTSLHTLILSGMAWLIIKICFFWMAFTLMLTKIEFAIFGAITMILMPFGMLRWTETYFNKCVNGVFHFGIKMMVLHFIFGILSLNADKFTWMSKNAAAVGTSLSAGDVANQIALYLLTALLVWQVPEMAAGMLNGSPTISGGTAVAGAGRAYGLGRQAYTMAKGVANRANKTIKAAGKTGRVVKGKFDQWMDPDGVKSVQNKYGPMV